MESMCPPSILEESRRSTDWLCTISKTYTLAWIYCCTWVVSATRDALMWIFLLFSGPQPLSKEKFPISKTQYQDVLRNFSLGSKTFCQFSCLIATHFQTLNHMKPPSEERPSLTFLLSFQKRDEKDSLAKGCGWKQALPRLMGDGRRKQALVFDCDHRKLTTPNSKKHQDTSQFKGSKDSITSGDGLKIRARRD